MNIKKMAATGALALATGMVAVPIAAGYPPQQLPTLLMLRFYILPTTDSCEQAACNTPESDNSVEPPVAAGAHQSG